jgi:hypothetical protein
MTRNLDRWFRFLCAAQAGAQLFFAAVAAQVVFSAAVAALPREHPRRQLAAELVGQMLQRLDSAALVVSGATVLIAIILWRRGASSPRRALTPLLAGLCALASIVGTTPAIQSMRAAASAGEPLSPRFGLMHALSTSLLVLGIAFFICSALFGGATNGPNEPRS